MILLWLRLLHPGADVNAAVNDVPTALMFRAAAGRP